MLQVNTFFYFDKQEIYSTKEKQEIYILIDFQFLYIYNRNIKFHGKYVNLGIQMVMAVKLTSNKHNMQNG